MPMNCPWSMPRWPIRDDELRQAPYRVLADWHEEHEGMLRIILPDTYGSKGFLDHAPDWLAGWTGIRVDSGDPVEGAEMAIRWWQERGEDPRDKLIIFSDGLDVAKVGELFQRFHGRVKVSFGWGTLLTNDFRGLVPGDGLAPFSLVCKAVAANGRPTVKLSDNPEKATGPKDEIARYRRVFETGRRKRIAVWSGLGGAGATGPGKIRPRLVVVRGLKHQRVSADCSSWWFCEWRFASCRPLRALPIGRAGADAPVPARSSGNNAMISARAEGSTDFSASGPVNRDSVCAPSEQTISCGRTADGNIPAAGAVVDFDSGRFRSGAWRRPASRPRQTCAGRSLSRPARDAAARRKDRAPAAGAKRAGADAHRAQLVKGLQQGRIQPFRADPAQRLRAVVAGDDHVADAQILDRDLAMAWSGSACRCESRQRSAHPPARSASC
jgi:hypothetical protein